MNLGKILYRPRQFWLALTARPGLPDLAEARLLLSPGELDLFERMQPGEQAHSLKVMRKLREEVGDAVLRELLIAALLHDVGKVLAPLQIWERVLVVTARWVLPHRVKVWGRGDLHSWRRPFVVAEQHPAWGAKLAEQAGSLPLVVDLIRWHQEVAGVSGNKTVESMLIQLKQADNDS